jgi:ribosomal protein S12 methylthiotransferase accessory factor
VSESLPKAFTAGTHRWMRPEVTLARVQPHLAATGIVRVADITGLDHLGVPVFCAIRPQARFVQVSSGKGFTAAAAEASAVMEAIEMFHAENPPAGLRRACALEIIRSGGPFAGPDSLALGDVTSYFSHNFVVDWVMGEELLSGCPTWLMACAAYCCEPAIFMWTSNGLASGNHLVEATLHGLYELIERDSFTRLGPDAQTRAVDLEHLDDPMLGELVERIRAAGLEVFLAVAPSRVPVCTFYAIIFDRSSFAASTRVTAGSGSHLSPAVAASRALTEAAQGRLGLIHASREDLVSFYAAKFPDDILESIFSRTADMRFRDLEDRATADLGADLDLVLRELASAGLRQVFRVDLTRPELGIPVARVIVPGLGFDRRMIH